MARPRLNKKITRTSISLDEQMFTEVSLLASQNDVSVAWLVRKAISELLERRSEEVVSQLPRLTTDRKSRGSPK
ncbi:ribbon-helix-helix domain-containing protein [Klebsiella pneumoniae]|uniref:ribbon-helix-helix domain-containing protein n=1 Tax=Klebsiella pneumoniae TaxID=573 RepID=UPI000E34B170